MSAFDPSGVPAAVDDKGYLVDFNAWTREIAIALAVGEELGELTAGHWQVIDFLREFHGAHGTVPMIRVLCRETGFSLQEIYKLFPNGPTKSACRVAGLPRPDSCV